MTLLNVLRRISLINKIQVGEHLSIVAGLTVCM